MTEDRRDTLRTAAVFLSIAAMVLFCDYLTELNTTKHMSKTDFYFTNSGTIITLVPQTDKARQWINDNLQLQGWQDPDRVPIETRMFEDIHAGIINDSLTITQQQTSY